MMPVKGENEYIDLAKVDLDTFTPYDGTFRERLDEYTLHHYQGKADTPEPENPIYNFLRGNGYFPSIEDARKWSLGVMRDKEATDRLSAFDLTPDSEEWFSIQMKSSFDYIEDDLKLLEEQFIGGFDIPKYVQYRSREDGVNYDHDDEPLYENMDDFLESIRIEHKNTSEMAFRIGFLYHDAWWKARHEEAARKHYEMLDRNKTNGQKGGHAEKKRTRHKCLDGLARDNIKSFIHVSDNEAARAAKRLAEKYDRDNRDNPDAPEPLFQDKGVGLSMRWYSEWLALFRRTAREI